MNTNSRKFPKFAALLLVVALGGLVLINTAHGQTTKQAPDNTVAVAQTVQASVTVETDTTVAKTKDAAVQFLKMKGYDVAVSKEGALTASRQDIKLNIQLAKTDAGTTMIYIGATGDGGKLDATFAERIARELQPTLPGSSTLTRVDATFKKDGATTTQTALASTQNR